MPNETRNWTPGPWKAARIANTQGEPATAEQIAEAIRASIELSAKDSGHTNYFFVSAGSGADERHVCLIGNGVMALDNMLLIRSAPALYEALKALLEDYEQVIGDGIELAPEDARERQLIQQARAALALAAGQDLVRQPAPVGLRRLDLVKDQGLAPLELVNTGDDIPQSVRDELFQCALEKKLSLYWLHDLYRRGWNACVDELDALVRSLTQPERDPGTERSTRQPEVVATVRLDGDTRRCCRACDNDHPPRGGWDATGGLCDECSFLGYCVCGHIRAMHDLHGRCWAGPAPKAAWVDPHGEKCGCGEFRPRGPKAPSPPRRIISPTRRQSLDVIAKETAQINFSVHRATPGSERPAAGWQDIATAPKDRYILLVQNLWIGIGRWGLLRYRDQNDDTHRWVDINGHSADGATHWMPLPSPPVDAPPRQEPAK